MTKQTATADRDWPADSKCTLHGIRKAAAVRLAERGATVEMLMSAFGWRSPAPALFYCREERFRSAPRTCRRFSAYYIGQHFFARSARRSRISARIER